MPILQDYLDNNFTFSDPTLSLLPLMHSCECFNAREILSSQVLETRFCNVFKERLLYFYYGKPSYPVGQKVEEYRTDSEYAPVCFILDLKKVVIHKVYPFDSGAFNKNLYGDFLHRGMKIDEFEISSNREAIKSYISFMFGNNENYLESLALNRDFKGSPYIEALVNMMTAKGSMKFDERARTIEVITKENVQIKDAVKCVILPKNLLQDDDIVSFLTENNIDIRVYRTMSLAHPVEYHGIIINKALEYIEEQKEVV